MSADPDAAPVTGEPGSILVLPGGGYHGHADHEAEPVADWLTSLGWRARVVRYPVSETHPVPLGTVPLDAVRTEIVAERAAGARRVGVLGFSAGGHLAGHAALAPDSTPEQRPDLAVLCYPVVSMLGATHVGSQENLLGPGAAHAEREATSLERLVTPSAPPMFLWHTVTDEGVLIGEHTYPLAAALAAHGVPHEVHAFADGPHGIGLAPDHPAREWTRLAGAWLSALR